MNKEIEKATRWQDPTIEMLYNKLDAQDKIINDQALEIARLKEDKETLVLTIKTILKDKEELEQKIDKAIEFIKNAQYDDELKNNVYGLTHSGTQKLLAILGEKENE